MILKAYFGPDFEDLYGDFPERVIADLMLLKWHEKQLPTFYKIAREKDDTNWSIKLIGHDTFRHN
jgi:hypothetical protein